jgi:hypothetical protein
MIRSLEYLILLLCHLQYLASNFIATHQLLLIHIWHCVIEFNLFLTRYIHNNMLRWCWLLFISLFN